MRKTLICLVMLLAAGCGKKESDPQFEPKIPYLVNVPSVGVSMEGVLPDGEIRIIDFGFPFSALKVGDIVLFYDYKRTIYVLHLIVAKQGGNWITQGSNPVTNKVADPTFLMRENYMGKYIGRRLDQ